MSNPDPLASLLRAGGRRPVPRPERVARARESVHAEWLAVVARSRAHRRNWLAAAALATLTFGLGTFVVLRPSFVSVASVARIEGEVVLEGEGVRRPVPLGDALRAGDQLGTTASGRALLRWADAATLRIDRNSRVRFDSKDELHLLQGTLYVEVDRAPRASPALIVTTAYGDVRHVGTRYEVRVTDAQLRVRVRDGAAVFSTGPDPPVRIEAGRQLAVGDGEVTLEDGPPAWDPAWEWTQTIAPVFSIEGRSLADTLEWLAYEFGVRVVYESPELRDRTHTVVLHGSIEGLELPQALTAVLSGSGFAFELHGDRIEVRETPAG